MNLAYVSPLPPVRSGVADYGAALLAHLRPHFERILAVVDGYVPDVPEGLVDGIVDDVQSQDWWDDGNLIALYHMGCNTRYHAYIYRALRRIPGITVLHDGNLLPVLHELTLARGDFAGFLREAALERGATGIVDGRAALRQGKALSPDVYLMLNRVARASLGVVVHSRWLRDRVLELYPEANVLVVPMLDTTPAHNNRLSRPAAKESLDYTSDAPLIGAFGYIAPSKQLDAVVRAFAGLHLEWPDARLACVGQIVPGYEFEGLLQELDLRGVVRVTGYVPDTTFSHYLCAVDVGVNLRMPTWGEASAPLVRLMARGVPTLVTDAGAFAELPDDSVVKVPAQPSVDSVGMEMRDLLSSEGKRERVGGAARAYVNENCDPSTVASHYAAFIRRLVCDGFPLESAGAPRQTEAR